MVSNKPLPMQPKNRKFRDFAGKAMLPGVQWCYDGGNASVQPGHGTPRTLNRNNRFRRKRTEGGQVAMCQIFAGQDPANYQYITRSVRLGGHATSIRLEATFWSILDELAESQGMTTPRFLSTLYDEVLELHGEIANFSSLLRVSCVHYLRGPENTVRPALSELAPVAAE